MNPGFSQFGFVLKVSTEFCIVLQGGAGKVD
jgi:hypothetical protein